MRITLCKRSSLKRSNEFRRQTAVQLLTTVRRFEFKNSNGREVLSSKKQYKAGHLQCCGRGLVRRQTT